jgi:hypothetical protein
MTSKCEKRIAKSVLNWVQALNQLKKSIVLLVFWVEKKSESRHFLGKSRHILVNMVQYDQTEVKFVINNLNYQKKTNFVKIEKKNFFWDPNC